jgi:hypothetical protein
MRLCWGARQDSNLQQIGYEPTALTIELQARFRMNTEARMDWQAPGKSGFRQFDKAIVILAAPATSRCHPYHRGKPSDLPSTMQCRARSCCQCAEDGQLPASRSHEELVWIFGAYATVQCKLTIIVMLRHANAGRRHHRAKGRHYDSDDCHRHRPNR